MTLKKLTHNPILKWLPGMIPGSLLKLNNLTKLTYPKP